MLSILIYLQGIIRRVQEDGPGRGNVDLDILPRSVRNRLKDIIEDVSLLIPFSSLAAGDNVCTMPAIRSALRPVKVLNRMCAGGSRDASARLTSMQGC